MTAQSANQKSNGITGCGTRKATDSGVPCTLEVVPGAIHGFDDFLPHANISRTFFESQCTSLREALNPEAARE